MISEFVDKLLKIVHDPQLEPDCVETNVHNFKFMLSNEEYAKMRAYVVLYNVPIKLVDNHLTKGLQLGLIGMKLDRKMPLENELIDELYSKIKQLVN